MGLRDMMGNRKREEPLDQQRAGPEFTFIRSDTVSQDLITPPDASAGHGQYLTADAAVSPTSCKSPRLSLDVFRRSRSPSASSQASHQSGTSGMSKRRLSQRLHLSRHAESSDNVPDNLPEIDVDPQDKEGAESQWERRATMLAGQHDRARSRDPSPSPGSEAGMAEMRFDGNGPRRQSPVSSQQMDSEIQEAIRLHEAGHLEKSTIMFARLADPQGANNPLSQLLYGLALR